MSKTEVSSVRQAQISVCKVLQAKANVRSLDFILVNEKKKKHWRIFNLVEERVKEEEKDVWGLYYQISIAIRSLAII